MRRLLAIFAPLAGIFVFTWQMFFGAAAVVAVPACSTTDAGLIQPLTGIEVLADTLTAGRGCGTGPGQVYKYAVVVALPHAWADAGTKAGTDAAADAGTDAATDAENDAGAGAATDAGTDADTDGGAGAGTDAGTVGGNDAGTESEAFIAGGGDFDCFANATFVNLCAAGTAYTVHVYAFTADQWNAVTKPAIAARSYCDFDAGVFEPTQDPETLEHDFAALASFTTKCTATEQLSVPVIASCGPLRPAHP